MEVAESNVLSADDARTLVNGCLGVPRWVDEDGVVATGTTDADAHRPFGYSTYRGS